MLHTLIFVLLFHGTIQTPHADPTGKDLQNAVFEFETFYDAAKKSNDSALMEKALHLAVQSRLLAKKAEEPIEAEFAFYQAKALRELGRYRGARFWFIEAAKAFDRLEKPGDAFWCYNAGGLMYMAMADFAAALDAYQKALDRVEEDQPEQLVTVHGNMAATYSRLGSYQLARDHLDRAMAHLDQRTNVDDAAKIRVESARLFRLEGRYRTCLELAREAAKPLDRKQHPSRLVAVLGEQAQCLMGLDRYQEADKTITEALEINAPLPETGDTFHLWNIQAESKLNLKHFTQAADAAQKALKGFAKTGEDAGFEQSLWLLARIAEAEQDPERAEQTYERLLQQLEERRQRYRGDFLLDYQGPRHPFYQSYIHFLMNRRRASPNADHALKALQLVERLRSGTSLEKLQLGSQLRLYDETREQHDSEPIYQATFEELMRGRLEGDKPSAQLEKAFRQVLARWETQRNQPQKLVPDRRNHVLPDQVLGNDEVLLYFELGKTESYAWLVKKDEFLAFSLPSQTIIEQQALSYLKYAGKRPGTTNRRAVFIQAQRLGELLFKSLMPHLKTSRILVIGDDILHRIPLAGLINPDSDNMSFLGERFQFVRLPSANYLNVLRQKAQPAPGDPRKVAVVADPVYEWNDKRLPPLPEERQRGAAHGTPPLNDRRLLKRLVFSSAEAESIKKLFKEENVLDARGFNASTELFKGQKLKDYSIIHIAAHGLPYLFHSQFSCLALSMYDKTGNPQQGFLSAYQIEGMQLNADLVFLSACESGLGKESASEGILGLPQAFLNAGSDRVITTLWPIGDNQTTVRFATDFYQAYKAYNGDASLALQKAQEEMRSSGLTSPYYWAGFVLIGDPKRNLSE